MLPSTRRRVSFLGYYLPVSICDDEVANSALHAMKRTLLLNDVNLFRRPPFDYFPIHDSSFQLLLSMLIHNEYGRFEVNHVTLDIK